MSNHVTGNVLSHNSTSNGTLERLLSEQQATNELLAAVLCQLQVLTQHMEVMTENEFED